MPMARNITNIAVMALSGRFLVALVVAAPLLVAQQEKPSPTSDYQYRKDYAEVEDGIKKEPDAQKRADMLLAFVKAHPQSRMIPHVSSYYNEIVTSHAKAGAWPKVISMNEAFLALVPDDKAATGSLLGAYFQTQNFAKTVELGEKVYATTPDKGVAFALATSYLQLKNLEKFTPYAEKTIPEFPIEQTYNLFLPLASVYAAKKDLDKAADYAGKLMAAFGDKLPPGHQESTWSPNRAFAYGLMGASVYAKKDYAKAIEYYEKAAKASPQADEPYYYIGLSKWQNKDTEGAIAAMAKVVVLNKAQAPKAKEHLEKLYKSLHNDSLDGLDQVLAKAKSELGIK
jgi:tetratricopeptide (TPR) repeat protein